MPSQTSDPRSYVRLLPTPIPSHKGIRIQARSDSDYVSAVKDRLDVQHENYVRRCLQLKEQGYRAADDKPYKGIGDPFYLEPKQMILNALGQLNLDNKNTDKGGIQQVESEDELDRINTTTNFSTNQSKADVEKNCRLHGDVVQLHKELNHGRKNMFRVQVGQDFFNIVKQEINEKERNEREEQLRREEMYRTMPRPPVSQQSTGDDDDDLSDSDNEYDDKNGCYNDGDGDNNDDVINDHEDVELSTSIIPEISELGLLADRLSGSSSSFRSSQRSRFQQSTSRPYTPKHNNIATTTNKLADRSALFRQLCILDWLLEAMNLKTPKIIRPLATCWNTYDYIAPEPGRGSRNERVAKDQTEREWRRTIMGPTFRVPRKSRLTTGSRYSTPRFLLVPRMTRESSLLSIGSDMMSLSRPESSLSHRDDVSIAAGNDLTGPMLDSDSVKTSASSRVLRPNSCKASSHLDLRGFDRIVSGSRASTSATIRNNTDRAEPDVERALVPAERAEEIKRISQKTRFINDMLLLEENTGNDLRERHTRSSVTVIRPSSSPAVMQRFRYNMPSNIYQGLTNRMRDQFVSIYREEELRLNDAIDSMHRARLKKLEHKFSQIPENMTVNAALKVIRRKQRVELQRHRAQKRPDMYQQWFLDLINLPIGDEKDKWYFQRVFDKLGPYGLVETGRQSGYKFKKVLSLLRDWEICSPDVCSAVEFCRDRIVDVSVEEYETWFRETFPSVQRPSLNSESSVSITSSSHILALQSNIARSYTSSRGTASRPVNSSDSI